MPKVNQQLIADRLNICRTTVSRCFSNHPKINPDTRAKVLELAAQLGYRYTGQRNTTERIKKKFTDIGVLIGVQGDMEEMPATSQALLKGISERAASQDLSLDIRYINPSELDQQMKSGRLPKGIRNGRWNGAVLIFPFTRDTVSSLSKRLSTVSIAEDYSEGGIDCIDSDHHAGIHKMVSHLADLGHRNVGFLTWRYGVDNDWSHRRFGAYGDSLYRLNLEFNPDWVLNVRPSESLDPEQIADIVAEQTRRGVTAWVCAADHQAFQLIEDLESRGLRVPAGTRRPRLSRSSIN